MLDILTPNGQKSVTQEQRAYKILSQSGEFEIEETDKTTANRYDAIVKVAGKQVALLETKCRTATVEQFNNWGSWLITLDKVLYCQRVSASRRIPFYGLLYSIESDRIMLLQITDSRGEFMFDFECKRTRTQRTCNGGDATRMNFFAPINQSNWDATCDAIQEMSSGGRSA